MTQKTEAVLIRAGRVVARCVTAARGGAVLSYGFERARGGALVEVGRGKVSRDRRYLGDAELISTLDDAIVNHGGGPDL